MNLLQELRQRRVFQITSAYVVGCWGLIQFFTFLENRMAEGRAWLGLALRERDAFKTHLRALLRSVDGGHLRLMFPMISDVSELRDVKGVLEEALPPLPAKADAALAGVGSEARSC